MTITTDLLHSDPTISAFLADGGYASIEAWMLDSDYFYQEADGTWMDEYDTPVDPEGVIEGAIEASGFEVDEAPGIDRYAVNDALSALAGGRLSDDDLNDLTHTVADAIDQA